MLKIVLIFLGIFLTPFYIFNSGTLQPSHLVLILFSIFSIFFNKNIILERKSTSIFIPFYVYVVFINSIYMIIYQDLSFFNYSLALTLNGLVFLAIIKFIIYGGNIRFINFIPFFSFFLLLFLFTMWLLGFGAYNYHPRYNGFFNDPNQMAFFVICCSAIGCLFSHKIYQSLSISLLGFFLVSLTLSRSGLLGFSFIILSFFARFLKFNIKSILTFSSLIFFVIITILYNLDNLLNNPYIQPFVERTSETDIDEQADIRGYTRIIDYSEYIIFGAGQGLDQRFGASREIHSTWAGLLFYYGIVGLGLFCYMISSIFFRLNLREKLLLLAPLMYGFSTFGIRTIIFWILLAFFYYAAFYLKNSKRSPEIV